MLKRLPSGLTEILPTGPDAGAAATRDCAVGDALIGGGAVVGFGAVPPVLPVLSLVAPAMAVELLQASG